MFDLSVARYETWPGPMGDAIVVCDAVLTVRGRTVMCSGVGATQEVAEAKMISEAAERIMYFECQAEDNAPQSSTGFAAHVTAEDAAKAARNELIERSFLDQLRRQPHSVTPQKSSESTWSYRVAGHECWVSVARTESETASGWGAGVNADVDTAERAAILEGFMMASSHASYGRRGNAITVLEGGADRLGQSIEVRHFPEIRVHDQPRHVCLATWGAS